MRASDNTRPLRLLQSLALSAILALPAPLSKACAWEDPDPSAVYSFFSPDRFHYENLSPFHFTWDRLYDYSLLEPSVSEDANLADWAGHLGSGISASDLRWLVYGSTEDDIAKLASSGQSRYPALSNLARSGKIRMELEYIAFAKQVEPLVGYWDEWDKESRDPDGDAQALAKLALNRMANASPFLKMRYGFQAVRLMHRNERYQEAIDLWEKHMRPLENPKSLIWWWSMCDYAGALRNQGRRAEASYYFTRVFDNCPSRRIQSWYGWGVPDQATWERALYNCKNNHERMMLYFMRCSSPNAVAAGDLRQMLTLEPGSPYAEFIVTREINKIEREALGWHQSASSPFHLGFEAQGGDASIVSGLDDLRLLVSQCAQSGPTRGQPFWLLADAYLHFLSGKFGEAQARLAKARPTLPESHRVHGTILDVAFQICGASDLSPATQDRLLKQVEDARSALTDDENRRLANLLDDGLSLMYRANGQKSLAMLARNETSMLWEKGSLADVDAMINFYRAPKVSRYEQMLAQRLGSDESHLLELKASRLMGENRFEEAIGIMRQLPASHTQTSITYFLEDDPFVGKVRDIINCEGRYCAEGKYNKLSYAEQVQALRKLTITDTKNIAKHQMALGHAFYNTSYYGPAWQTLDYYRRDSWYNYEWYDGEERPVDAPENDIDDLRDHLSMDLARQYYTAALQNAPNPEFAAEACYHLAKVTQNYGYMDGLDWTEQERPQFDQLMRDYRGTRFYNRIIRECSYFRLYTNR